MNVLEKNISYAEKIFEIIKEVSPIERADLLIYIALCEYVLSADVSYDKSFKERISKTLYDIRKQANVKLDS